MTPRSASLLLLAPLVAMGIAVGCVGSDPATASDSGAPTATTTTQPTATTTTTAATDAAVADTFVPDTSVPDAAPFSPSQVTGLQLWLDPAAGLTQTGGKVSSWSDQSPSRNNVIQTDGALQPTVGTAGSKPVIVFTAATWLGRDAAMTNLDFATSDLLVECVVGIDTASTALTGVLYKGTFDAPTFDGLQLYANLSRDGKPGGGLDGDKAQLLSPNALATDGKLHLLAYRRVGSRLSFRVDGTEVATATVTPRSIDSVSPLTVGGRASGVHNAPNKLGDVLIYRGAVADTDLTKIEAYLKQKDGI